MAVRHVLGPTTGFWLMLAVGKYSMCTRNSWLLATVVIAIEAMAWSCQRSGAPVDVPPPAPVVGQPNKSRIVVHLTEAGFVPARIPAEVGKPITLAITRKTDRTCAREILFKGQPGKTELPLDREVEVTYTPRASGTVPFGCAMGMMVGGTLEVR
jgi:Cupredoxin-like domain